MQRTASMQGHPVQSHRLEERAEATLRDPRWRAVVDRDAAADGGFVFAVRTTGVFCRPSCRSRAPRPENVEFFGDAAAAARAGYRPCKRCTPRLAGPAQRRAVLVERLCRRIEAAPVPPTLQQLAEYAKLSVFHVQRLFRAVTGVTPRAYAGALRAARLRSALADGRLVTSAMHAAGYGSTSRLHAAARTRLGMTPVRYRSGGDGETMQCAVAPCALGFALVAATARGIAAILLGDDAGELQRDLRKRFARATIVAGDAAFLRSVAVVVRHVEQPREPFPLPLDIRGTLFQQRVWQALQKIPAGSTASYAEVARALGAPSATRAVAGACAANPLAVAVPCHRVVRADGGLSGYRWGVHRKRALLARESGG